MAGLCGTFCLQQVQYSSFLSQRFSSHDFQRGPIMYSSPAWRSFFQSGSSASTTFRSVSDFQQQLGRHTFTFRSSRRPIFAARTNGGGGFGGKGAKKKSSGSGFGSGAAKSARPAPAVDPAVLLRRSEAFYQELIQPELLDEGLTREFIICVRVKELQPDETQILHDWLPIASLALVSEVEAETCLRAALPMLRREVAHCVADNRTFKNIPRTRLEYAAESMEDFEKHVYKNVTGGSGASGGDSEEDPYSILGLSRTATAGQVKTAYRALAAVHHPDKHQDPNHDKAMEMFKKITKAYEDIKKGGGHRAADFSRYAAIGGSSARTLIGPIDVSKVGEVPLPENTEVAVRRLEADMVNLFIQRAANQSKPAVKTAGV